MKLVMITYSMRTASFLLPRLSTALHCICVHCALVDSCTAYHFVEEQHSQPHVTSSPTFSPQPGSPRIEAHVHTGSDSLPGYLRTDSSKLGESMDTIELLGISTFSSVDLIELCMLRRTDCLMFILSIVFSSILNLLKKHMI